MGLRRRMPAHLQPVFDAFAQVVVDVERGKAALAGSVPSTRFAGRPLAEALLEFEEALSAAGRNMRAWRHDEVAEEWEASTRGLRRARDLAARARMEAPPPGGFEDLVGLIGALLAPLEAFGDARDAFGRLRRSAPRRAGSRPAGPSRSHRM